MRKKRGLLMIGSLGLIGAGLWFWPRPVQAQWPVHDPIHTALNSSKWVVQLERMHQQIEQLRRRIRQWDEDFTKLWGQPSGLVHDALRTTDQILYAASRPWDDVLRTREEIYNALNQITRHPRTQFEAVQRARDGFTFIRPDIDRYRHLSPSIKEYYRALGHLSAEGLYVSARSYEAGERLGRDAQRLNEYARDTSPAGAAKTQAFAASVATYAQAYQLETQNRILRQLAYLNMKQENDQRLALHASAAMQEALAHLYRDVPVKTHLID